MPWSISLATQAIPHVWQRGILRDTLSLSQDVQDKLARIPDLPSADGNYALTCTISGGVPTFAWTLATN